MVIDLSHKIMVGMPVFPGTEAPKIERAFTIDKNHYAEARLTMFSHVGTHMDAPAHMISGGKTLDAYAIDAFIGKACVLDFSKPLEQSGEWEISLEQLKVYEGLVEAVDFVLIYTGWSHKWGVEAYFKDFPALSVEGAKWLSEKHLKGIGIDAMSIDLMSTKTFPVHFVFMEKEMVIIENLTNVEALLGKVFTLHALPLKIDGSDGAPIRAVGLL